MAAARSRSTGGAARPAPRSPPRIGPPKPLYATTDHGAGIVVAPELFAPLQRNGGWGPFLDPFLHANERALALLDVRPEIKGGSDGAVLRLVPSGRAGAIPLRSSQTQQVLGGLVVRPRFGWPGLGRVLSETGWHAGPEFLELPMVPGSGREVPPWVLAGPVLERLRELLQSMRRGYVERDETLRWPRGHIDWTRYATGQLARGRWDTLPCRYPDLALDPMLRSYVRWTLDRIHRDLVSVGGRDPIALALATLASRLLEQLFDVPARPPTHDGLRRMTGGGKLVEQALRRGVEALGWILDERGLGGGRELDGLAWQVPLDRLWEAYVEADVRREAAAIGADVRVGRLGQTTFPIMWSDPTHRSLGHLVPDLVVRKGKSVRIIDAKYKAHLAEIDAERWYRLADEVRDAHRADVHQVLAYAALYDADEITATLVYPLRQPMWAALHQRGHDISRAELAHGGRLVRLELRGLPFGRSPDADDIDMAAV
ncbi:MAG: hypothetical protein U0359_15380 [Byssovorax sp.]